MDIAARPNLDIFQRDRAKGQQEKIRAVTMKTGLRSW